MWHFFTSKNINNLNIQIKKMTKNILIVGLTKMQS